ncbi:hypothetical protein ABFT23_10450 [Nocardioides sp. C4-1]|uniref:hypothetical protein n=1 Tax=Nocardioides sp. C4-1 TaxID=3151851 RepID=UPI0032672FB6
MILAQARNAAAQCGEPGLRDLPRARTFLRCGLVVLLLALLGVGPAVADDPGPTLRTADGGPLRFDDLAPGVPVSRTILVRGGDVPTRMRLSLSGLASLEGECLDAEVRAGDTSCDAHEGELLSWLRARIERLDGEGPVLVAERTFTSLATDPVDLGDARPDATVQLRMTVWPDRDAGSDTMSDAVEFVVGVSARGLTAELPSGGSTHDGDGDSDNADDRVVAGMHDDRSGWTLLPRTGSLLDPLHLTLGLGLVVLGGALVGRRPRT